MLVSDVAVAAFLQYRSLKIRTADRGGCCDVGRGLGAAGIGFRTDLLLRSRHS